MIQYLHVRDHNMKGEICAKGGATYVLDVPPKAILESILSVGLPVITMDFGFVVCHPKDAYVKQIGRDLARRYTRKIIWTLQDIRLQDKERIWHFYNEEFSLQLRTKTDSNIVRISDIYKHGR